MFALSKLVAAPRALDKLPHWIALPVGLAAGVHVGRVVAAPGLGMLDVAGSVLVLGIALFLAMSAPRAMPIDDRPAAQPEQAQQQHDLYN